MASHRQWQLAASFDTAFSYRKDGSVVDEAVFAKHHVLREEHYRVAREVFGFNRFRDGITWSELMTGSCQIDWGKFERSMDQLAHLSLKGHRPEIDLVLWHYSLPLLAAEDFFNGRLQDFLETIADRVSSQWRDCFRGYIVSVENGYATAMQTHLNNWRYSASATEPNLSWWELFEARMKIAIAMAKVLHQNDPQTDRMACEPYYHCDIKFRDQVRSLRTILGAPDKAAKVYSPGQTDQWGGYPELLTDIGLNFYGNQDDDFEHPTFPLSKLLLSAKKRFPNHQLRIAETGNCQVADQVDVARWLEMIDREVNLANSQGAEINLVTWSPFLTIEDFTKRGKVSEGALLPLHSLKPDPKIVTAIRQYTDALPIKRAAHSSSPLSF